MRTPSASEKQALLSLLLKLYEEIRAIESQWGVFVSAEDFRPRIEYFHDAVRDLTSGEGDAYSGRGRLSVEHLAHDIAYLRHIQSAPLPAVKALKPRSPGTAVVQRAATPDSRAQPDRAVKGQLADLYKNYTIFFTALMAESADRNYHARTDAIDEKVEDMAALEQMLQMIAQGQGEHLDAEVEERTQEMEDAALKNLLQAMLHQAKLKKRQMAQEAAKKLKEAMRAADKQAESVNRAHMDYLSNQLVVYEESKDVVKKLAIQGLNMAGRFLEAALVEAAGRGRGR